MAKAHHTAHKKPYRGVLGKVIDLNKDIKRVKEKAMETTEAITTTAKDVKGMTEEMVQGTYNDIKDRTLTMEETVVSYIKDNPLKAAGYSVLAGALLSMFLRRK